MLDLLKLLLLPNQYARISVIASIGSTITNYIVVVPKYLPPNVYYDGGNVM